MKEADQILFTAAVTYLKGVMNGKTTIPTKEWKAEYVKLTAEQKTLNGRYLALKGEVKEAKKFARAFTIFYGERNGSSSPARCRMWIDKNSPTTAVFPLWGVGYLANLERPKVKCRLKSLLILFAKLLIQICPKPNAIYQKIQLILIPAIREYCHA